MLLDKTIKYITSTDKNILKARGQYFTPNTLKDYLFKSLPKTLLTTPNLKVCEPSFGSGEFLSSIYQHLNEPYVEGFEIDNNLFSLCDGLYDNCLLVHGNTLAYERSSKYDIIVGNPPYFKYVPTNKERLIYSDVISGRVNIYQLFIKWCLDSAKPGGYVALILPTSMNTGSYFKALRTYILKTAQVIKVKLFSESDFVYANQKVQCLILRKKINTGSRVNKKHIINLSTGVVFVENTKDFGIFKEGKSLKDLGYKVCTGTVVWNTKKEHLSNDPADTLLVWAHNIKGGSLELSARRPQYIKSDTSNFGTGIVVNRIIGVSNKAKLNVAIVEGKWVAENHVNVILPIEGLQQVITMEEIVSSLLSSRVQSIIKLISGNTQLSKTELECCIPII